MAHPGHRMTSRFFYDFTASRSSREPSPPLVNLVLQHCEFNNLYFTHKRVILWISWVNMSPTHNHYIAGNHTWRKHIQYYSGIKLDMETCDIGHRHGACIMHGHRKHQKQYRLHANLHSQTTIFWKSVKSH
jgi:hypothetical protein